MLGQRRSSEKTNAVESGAADQQELKRPQNSWQSRQQQHGRGSRKKLIAGLTITVAACNLVALLLFTFRTSHLHSSSSAVVHDPSHDPHGARALLDSKHSGVTLAGRGYVEAKGTGGTAQQGALQSLFAAGGMFGAALPPPPLQHLVQKEVHVNHDQAQTTSVKKWQLQPGAHRCDPEYMGPDEYPDPKISSRQKEWPLWWMAPFFDKTSFGKEAATLVLGAVRSGALQSPQLWVGTTQGDCYAGVDDSMPRADYEMLEAAHRRQNKCAGAIVVCHSLPPFWARPKNRWETCQPCPPVGYTPAVTVGRAMAETDRYHPEFVATCNRMDEIWVPSQFSAQVLNASGVTKPLIRILPIAVNTTLYNPRTVTPLDLPVGELVFGEPQRVNTKPVSGPAHAGEKCMGPPPGSLAMGLQSLSDLGSTLAGKLTGSSTHEAAGPPKRKRRPPTSRAYGSLGPGLPVRPRPFTFVTTFKWEMRKGWDSLLSAYLQEFTVHDNVELYILTKPFLTGGDFLGQMQAWARQHLGLTEDQNTELPTVYVISQHLSQEEYSGLYKSADAFVLATRGEGWGMPISESMSMGLPVIVTNWSGVTAYVDDKVGYPVDYTLVKVPADQPWWFQGAQWADADVPHLRARMREVMTWPQEAVKRGREARKRMVEKYDTEVVGRLIADEYARLKQMIRNGTCKHCQGKKWVASPGDFKTDLYTGLEPFLVNQDLWGAGSDGGFPLTERDHDFNALTDQLAQQLQSLPGAHTLDASKGGAGTGSKALFNARSRAAGAKGPAKAQGAAHSQIPAGEGKQTDHKPETKGSGSADSKGRAAGHATSTQAAVHGEGAQGQAALKPKSKPKIRAKDQHKGGKSTSQS